MIPFCTGQVRLLRSSSINSIVLQVSDATQLAPVTMEITTQLKALHELSASQPADFNVRNNNIINRVSSVDVGNDNAERRGAPPWCAARMIGAT